MCGFAVTNVEDDVSLSNEKCLRRGPDKTNILIHEKIQFLHNLLHITGKCTYQPLFKKNVCCVFNGEIYNYKDFSENYENDSECIIDLYLENGINFSKKIDGEFAICIVDFSKNKIILSTDLFSCKPLWFEFKNQKFCVASYKSQLLGLGFKKGKKVPANKTIIFNLKNLKKEEEINNYKLNLKQNKNNFDDWIEAFSKSISKRTKNTDQKIFIGLSSGYDSGAIACELQKQKIFFKTYSITNSENKEIIKERVKTIKENSVFNFSKYEFEKSKSNINSNCEFFKCEDYNILNQANVGFNFICKKAKSEGCKIVLLGQGADEIISDYGFGGKKIYKCSCFGGLFPNKLEDIFPWENFWKGTQEKYTTAQEYIAGSHGIEARYPFLDKKLVQEFLSLSTKLKNIKYKSCLSEYLIINNYPFEKDKKRGFYCK